VRLGLLQLRRSARRTTGLTATVTALSLLVLTVSSISSTLSGSLAGAIDTMEADVIVLTSASQGTLQASRITPETIEGVSHVDGVSRLATIGELRVTALLDGRPVDASLFGVDPRGPGLPAEIATTGRWPLQERDALVDDADERRGATPGAAIAIQGTDVVLDVVGTTTGARFGGILTVYTHYDTWEVVFGQLFPDATELRPTLVAVDASAGTDPDLLARRITDSVAGVRARTPSAAAMELPGMTGIRDSFRLISVITVGSALLLVASFWLLTTAHQARPLAVLNALGVRQAHLVRALLTQVVVVVGMGVLIAWAALTVVVRSTPPTYPLRADPQQIAGIAIVLLIGAVVAVLPAARRILSIDPLTALAQADR
jgi:putative ABC transport system permease protein